MKMSVDELLNECIMASCSTVLVEGIDDVEIYESLIRNLNKNCDVLPIEYVENYSEGSVSLVNCIVELNSMTYPTTLDIEKFILGIIDKDVRDFRNELVAHKCLLTLNVYSIESHLIDIETFRLLLSIITKAGKNYFGQAGTQELFQEIQTELLELYYCSLEALRTAVDPNYNNSCFQYENGIGRRNDAFTNTLLESRKGDLDEFARERQIAASFNTLLKITKGKWLFEVFCQKIIYKLNNPSLLCGAQDNSLCKPCETGNVHKCLYRLKAGINHETLQSISRGYLNPSSVGYINVKINYLN